MDGDDDKNKNGNGGAAGDDKNKNTPPPGGNGGNREADEIANVRAEAAAHRVEARRATERAEKAEKDLEKERKEKEKAVEEERKKGGEAAEKLKTRTINSEVKAKAVAEGLEDADLLPLIMQNFGKDIKMDDDGNVVGIDEAIVAAKEKKPSWFKTSGGGRGGGDGGAGGSGSGKKPAPVKDVKPRNARTMSKEDYRKFKADEMKKLREAS